MLTAAQEADLLDNLWYINIHSQFAGGGEIRGQLVAVPEPTSAFMITLGFVALMSRRWRR